jgi:electron transport complex protein RnfC
MSVTFKGGIHPPYNKSYTDKLPIVEMPAPKEAAISMSMHIGAPAGPIVEVGQEVKMGDLIGKAPGFVSSNVHASVSGVVAKIEPRLMSNGGKATCVVIENDFKDTPSEGFQKRDWQTLSKEELLAIIGESGSVGLGGATFPTRVKLSIDPKLKIDFMILNGAECEPYLTNDHALMREEPEKVIGGLKIMMKIVGVEKGHIGVESNKPDAIAALRAAAGSSIEIVELETKYPQGGEKQLISAITGREVPSGGLPSAVGCVVCNVATSAAVYEAVSSGKPVYERIATVTGSGIKTPKVVRFRIGTPVSEIIDFCGGLTDDVAKVVFGGPMMGFAQYDMSIPSTKGTSGILCMNRKDAAIGEPTNCISCTKCVKACPMHLMPLYIAAYAEKGSFEKCEEYYALDCIECGSCAFVCPARRPLVSSIRLAKREVAAIARARG